MFVEKLTVEQFMRPYSPRLLQRRSNPLLQPGDIPQFRPGPGGREKEIAVLIDGHGPVFLGIVLFKVQAV